MPLGIKSPADKLAKLLTRRAVMSSGTLSRPEPEAGYRMIESFAVSNFKCFDALELKDLKRVNIITGANASGKSALLEALLCAARGTAEALLATNTLRNLHASNIGSLGLLPLPVMPGLGGIPAQNFHALWDHLFYAVGKNGFRRVADKIELRYSDSDHKKYSVEIAFIDAGQQSQPQPSVIARSATAVAAAALTPLRVSRGITSPDGATDTTDAIISLNPQGQIQGSSILPQFGPSLFIFSSVIDYAEIDNVTWFSQLREKGEHEEIVKFIREQFPFIYDIEVLAPFGASGLFASLKSGGVRRLQLVSSGINKIITLLLACANATNGVILVDEIENGIFYEKYEFMWSVLHKFAERFSCQLFVTSHSLECLEKIVPVMGNNVGDFSLIRTERENAKCVAHHISGTAMAAALRGQNEIRGATFGSPSGNS